MSQLWQIINVDRREAKKNVWGQLGVWFFYPHDQLITCLSIPCLPKVVDQWLAQGPTVVPPGPISKLPTELIHVIFDSLHTLHETISFSITCKLFLSIGKPHILRATKAHYAPWAGCRLITLGDDTRSLDDLPPGLLTDAERIEIEATGQESTDPDQDGPDEHEQSLSYFSCTSFERVLHLDWRMRRINAASQFAGRIGHWRVLNQDENDRDPTSRDASMFLALYGDGRRAPCYQEGTRVLCNFSKGEYVRQDGLTSPKYVNLGHALLSRICWSSSADIGMVCEDEYRAQLMKGPWAGDRFCVTTMELLPELEDSAVVWRDVTAEAQALLSHIWDNNSMLWRDKAQTWDVAPHRAA
ncbi:hypothetical protein L226DRAFT_566143 [Lentinus tigrinus ALCF2SS1-7]|uniref:uncharacterized protein n=1 Tax=Lentinus tigrinus ALCF2SS1-7 TaxID=1328758 RepID=UPI0011660DA9|nr:hypothetical protein L226DRAFT_566143 [Lentinus tigrinus ALCF2SS1-7]